LLRNDLEWKTNSSFSDFKVKLIRFSHSQENYFLSTETASTFELEFA